jgi:hypothetical protein
MNLIFESLTGTSQYLPVWMVCGACYICDSSVAFVIAGNYLVLVMVIFWFNDTCNGLFLCTNYWFRSPGLVCMAFG